MDLHNFKLEQVHVVNPYDGQMPRRFRCHRCKRDLPEDSFGIMRTPFRWASEKVQGMVVLHPCCWTCRSQTRGEWTKHPDYTPGMDRFWHQAIQRLKAGARNRSILVAVDKDDLLGLFLKQGQRCALTGMRLDWKAKGRTWRNGSRYAVNMPSADRIHSNGNYTLDNIQIVSAAVNVMKSDLSPAQFVELCRRVVAKADQALSATKAA